MQGESWVCSDDSSFLRAENVQRLQWYAVCPLLLHLLSIEFAEYLSAAVCTCCETPLHLEILATAGKHACDRLSAEWFLVVLHCTQKLT